MQADAYTTWHKAGSDDCDPEAGDTCPPLRLPRDWPQGIGLLTGFFGVGGGFLIVPTMAIGLAFTMRTAVGTSLAIITATSLVGFLTHLAASCGLDAGLTATMATACVIGVLLGASAASRVPQRLLGRGFAVMVVAVALYLLTSVLLLGGPPGAG
jgi:uncharacterized membrane protein YfcA